VPHPQVTSRGIDRRRGKDVVLLCAGSQKLSIAYGTYFCLSEETFPSQMLFISSTQLKEKEEAGLV